MSTKQKWNSLFWMVLEEAVVPLMRETPDGVRSFFILCEHYRPRGWRIGRIESAMTSAGNSSRPLHFFYCSEHLPALPTDRQAPESMKTLPRVGGTLRLATNKGKAIFYWLEHCGEDGNPIMSKKNFESIFIPTLSILSSPIYTIPFIF